MKKILFSTFIILFSFISLCYSLDPKTHKDLNKYIASNTINGFSLDSYLRDQLGLQNGKNEILDSKYVWQSLRDGGKYEDIPPGSIIPYLRSFHHFHNP